MARNFKLNFFEYNIKHNWTIVTTPAISLIIKKGFKVTRI